MADRLKTRRRRCPSVNPRRLRKALARASAAVLACALAIASARGAGLPDPTRPPASVQAWEAAGAGTSAATPPAGPVLQSVTIAPSRRSAMISGQTVTVGSRYGDARVTRISETEVVLRGPDKTETLRLFPDVQKRPVPAPRGATQGRTDKTKGDAASDGRGASPGGRQ